MADDTNNTPWPLPPSWDHPEFEEALADHLKRHGSSLVGVGRYADAYQPIMNAQDAYARASATRLLSATLKAS